MGIPVGPRTATCFPFANPYCEGGGGYGAAHTHTHTHTHIHTEDDVVRKEQRK